MSHLRSWLPWRFVLRRLAHAHGFLDPLALYARLERFAQPAEVAEPIELLRAGAVFHARGLVNSRAIQHNLDWVWPYWAERQFDPGDVSFLPRAFSLTHVNLTHRNWTAIGLPGSEALPIVDPRGLLTPFHDGWSLDVWALDESGATLLPSRAREARQRQLHAASTLAVETTSVADGFTLVTDARLLAGRDGEVCRLAASATLARPGWLVVALRPCNPEGVSFVDTVRLDGDRRGWLVDGRDVVRFDQAVERHHASRYHDADVFVRLAERAEIDASRCPVGLASAAAMFRVLPDVVRHVRVDVPMSGRAHDGRASDGRLPDARAARHLLRRAAASAGDEVSATVPDDAAASPTPRPTRRPTPVQDIAPPPGPDDWDAALASAARLELPDPRAMHLYEAALRTLVLCTPGEVYAGPYTYRRYWYRDAAFVAHALLAAGLVERAGSVVERFPERQTRGGYFHSQEGEWDANGQVIWIAERLHRASARTPEASLWSSLAAGADWIVRKRLPSRGGQPHEGLMPAGFSAEHLGPIDHYYWDSAWSLAGLEAAARLGGRLGESGRTTRWREAAAALRGAIERSLERLPHPGERPAIPAAPARRLDAGAIGSLAFSYPLQLRPPDDPWTRGTVEFLLARCFHDGGFFQDMIHSGVNAYLTLHVAQTLLRAGDARHAALLRRVAELASPTGHWPEAVHPHTGGGCMGDGHHAWAAAEWIAMLRNAFVREEGETLHLASGLAPEWLAAEDATLVFGPTPTSFGAVEVRVEPADASERRRVRWRARWHDDAPALAIGPAGDGARPVAASDVGDEGALDVSLIGSNDVARRA